MLKDITDTTVPRKIAQISSFIDFAKRYKWAISNANLTKVKKLGLTDIKKYEKCASQVKIELDGLHKWILILTIFMRYLRKRYDNKKMNKNRKIKQNIKLEWVSFIFV